MYQTKAKLVLFFNEMMNELDKFKRNTYDEIFFEALKKNDSLLKDLTDLIEGTPEEEKDAIIEEMAFVLPNYVKPIIANLDKKQRHAQEMNYNLNMAVYIIPVLTYTKNSSLEKLAHRTVELWNEKKVTSLTLKYSTYAEIDRGYKKKLCYITTAVCQHQNKPDDCYELTTIRAYRDFYLMQTEKGREIVNEYYNIAPGLVMMMDMQNDAGQIYQNIYKEYLIPCIQHIENERNEECCELYMQMVNNLKEKYLYS